MKRALARAATTARRWAAASPSTLALCETSIAESSLRSALARSKPALNQLLRRPLRWHAQAPPSLRNALPRSGSVWSQLRCLAAAPSPQASADAAPPSLPTRRAELSASLSRRAGDLWALHRGKAYLALAGVSAVVAWRTMFWAARGFLGLSIGLSERFAEAGFFALAVSGVALTAQLLAWRRSLDPEAVYRHAMRQLSADSSVTALLGTPLALSETRAFVLSGGTLRLKDGWRPALSSKRCHLLFPLRGPRGRGIVSAAAKRSQGRYVFSLLALDVPSGSRGEARVYLHGDDKAYNKSEVLAELRDPLIASLVAEPAQEQEEDGDVAERALEAGWPTEQPAAAAAAATLAGSAHEQPMLGDGAGRAAVADDDMYAYDYAVAWLRRKRAAQAEAREQRRRGADAAAKQ